MRTKRNDIEALRQMRGYALALVAALWVGGCAAATPGYMPPPAPKSANKPALPMSKPFDAGTVTPAGSYAVSDAERALDCKKISGSMQIIMRRLDDTPNRPTQSQSSKMVQALAAPAAHGKAPLALGEEVVREKARLQAYNQLLVEKKCKPLDIARYA